MSDVGVVDPLISIVTLENSSEATEAAWVNSVLGTNYDGDYIGDNKIEDLSTSFMSVDGDVAEQYAFELPEENGYFLIKTGNGNTSYSHWLFKNDPNTFYGTFIIGYEYTVLVDGETFLEDGVTKVQFDANNIESISHFAGIGAAPVPEPSTLLLGAGLGGLGGWARRFKK